MPYSLERYSSQEALFAHKPNRISIQKQKLDPDRDSRSASINVWRNHSFEPFESLISPYIAFGGWHATYQLSDYDDSLIFAGRRAADLDLLWLDSDRYLNDANFCDWSNWLIDRILALRAVTPTPIVVATWLADGKNEELKQLIDPLPGVYFADLGTLCSKAGVELIDTRSAAMAGTPIGREAQPIVARKLACHWLPSTLFPPIKAVAVDLDNTLHAGVLGEDGIAGVRLTPEHRDFQSYLKSLRDNGVFLALVSRNEMSDVEALFRERQDFPLRWSDFSVADVSWDDKSAAILRVAEVLRIAPNAILFVDDNPGELASVGSLSANVNTLYAHLDASMTRRAVEYYPRLWRWKIELDDTKRIEDLKANSERQKLLSYSPDSDSYFRSLGIVLTFRYDSLEMLTRISELCAKTNQFNLALRRLNQAELAERMQRIDACVASVQMSDKLSDSGIIAVIVGERHHEKLVIEELCVSCRALGRQLEDTMLLEAIRGMPKFSECREIAFRFSVGPRNQPALQWLEKLDPALDAEAGLFTLPAGRLASFVAPESVVLIKD